MFVKICGVTTEEDALLAVAMDADAVGFTFAPSTRQVTAAMARDIARRLPPEIMTVGVFRDEVPQRVVDIVHTAGLQAAQLHGHESPEVSQWIRERVPYVIKAFVAGSADLDHSDDFHADAVLIDSQAPGSGEVFDWSLAEGAPAGRKVIIAGGLTPDNVADAIERIRPWGVDVASGVEVGGGPPGRKDPRLVRAFVRNARAAELPAYESSFAAPYDWMDDSP
jgi:phosphoribosylanthranilate isomerase